MLVAGTMVALTTRTFQPLLEPCWRRGPRSHFVHQGRDDKPHRLRLPHSYPRHHHKTITLGRP
jgi:hypothetical protein